ncbi:MAG: hypothetical protein ACP5OZ_02870 [Candidatus Woesearchaeota archaeon]
MPFGDGTGPLGLGCGYGYGRYGRGCGFGYGFRRGAYMFSDEFVQDKDLKKGFLEAEIKRIDEYKKFLERALEDIKK